VIIVVVCGAVLTELLARTPLAIPLTGRAQASWPRLRHRRPGELSEPAGPLPATAELRPAAPEAPRTREPAALMAVAYQKNGT
jgi:hypothetical protein